MADPRGFDYALRPLALKAEWDVTAALAELARLNHAMSLVERSADDLAQAQAQAHRFVRERSSTERLDPAAQQVAYRYLGQLQGRIDAVQRRLQELDALRTQMTDALRKLRHFDDGIQRHRKEAVRAHAQQLAQADYRNSDDVWLQRLIWRQQQ